MLIHKDISLVDLVKQAEPIPENRGEIYFLLDGDEVVYVGQTVSGITRIQTHAKDDKKVFDRYVMYECPDNLMNEAEAYFIVKFSPRYNMTIPPNRWFIPISTIKKMVGNGWVLRRTIKSLGIEPAWGGYYRVKDVDRIIEFVNS